LKNEKWICNIPYSPTVHRHRCSNSLYFRDPCGSLNAYWSCWSRDEIKLVMNYLAGQLKLSLNGRKKEDGFGWSDPPQEWGALWFWWAGTWLGFWLSGTSCALWLSLFEVLLRDRALEHSLQWALTFCHWYSSCLPCLKRSLLKVMNFIICGR
jgi:hypothetical protein